MEVCVATVLFVYAIITSRIFVRSNEFMHNYENPFASFVVSTIKRQFSPEVTLFVSMTKINDSDSSWIVEQVIQEIHKMSTRSLVVESLDTISEEEYNVTNKEHASNKYRGYVLFVWSDDVNEILSEFKTLMEYIFEFKQVNNQARYFVVLLTEVSRSTKMTALDFLYYLMEGYGILDGIVSLMSEAGFYAYTWSPLKTERSKSIEDDVQVVSCSSCEQATDIKEAQDI